MIAIDVKKVQRIHNLGAMGTSFEMDDGTVQKTGVAFFHALKLYCSAVDQDWSTLCLDDHEELIL